MTATEDNPDEPSAAGSQRPNEPRPSTPDKRRVVQLPDRVANQIAAGEVVARPASVVKELVENALDAGARNLHVEIEGGGVARVHIVDDGHGMDRQDAVLALSRHATSKLLSVDDLKAIQTLGFRGEALPSIASVSRFRLRSRPVGSDAGTELQIEGGAPAQIMDCGCAVGTSAEVRDLFYNVPARRKFLRALATESAHVTDVVRAAALAHPGVSFTLVRDGRRARQWLRTESRQARVRDVFHDYQLLSCEGRRGPAFIEAHLSEPQRARSGAGGLALFVNDRPVQDRALARAVASAYGEALERGRYPVGAVFIELAPELVDVNVHPQKAQVRFAHARALSDAVYSIIAAQMTSSLGLPARTLLQHPPSSAPTVNPVSELLTTARGAGRRPTSTTPRRLPKALLHQRRPRCQNC